VVDVVDGRAAVEWPAEFNWTGPAVPELPKTMPRIANTVNAPTTDETIHAVRGDGCQVAHDRRGRCGDDMSLLA
jgi:hypothetical protein